MAKLLSYYTKLLAAIAAALTLLWGWLAWAAPVPLDWMFGSKLMVWGPALWFLYLALRFGNPRSAARFYSTSVRPWGRAKILLFGIVAIGSLALGAVVGLVVVHPELAEQIGAWVPIAGLFIAMFYLIIAHFGSRKHAFASGLIRVEGEPVFEAGSTVDAGALKFPYRG